MTLFLVVFPIVMKPKDKRLPSKQSTASDTDFIVGSAEKAFKEAVGVSQPDYEIAIAQGRRNVKEFVIWKESSEHLTFASRNILWLSYILRRRETVLEI